jgi:pyruvate-formate lyase-activating enzyme
VGDENHPEHGFMPLDKAKKICKTLVEVYNNNSVDIQGGEPTIWEDIFELVRYCKELGLDPTLITNAQALSQRQTVVQFKEVGIRDFLVSLHGLGPVYDNIVGVQGAHSLQMEALKNLQEVGVPFRFNSVMSKAAIGQLLQIAELGVRTGAQVVNFLNYNPFDYQREEGRRTRENVPTYTEAGESLNEALDVLAEAGVEGSVRHFPICMVAERHRKSIYTHHQMPYDLHENDFASWAWSGLPAQRGIESELSHLVEFGPRVKLGPLGALRRLGEIPYVGKGLIATKRAMDRAWSKLWIKLPGNSLESKYQADARRRALENCGYQHVDACLQCDARLICAGYHNDYEALFGTHEATPIQEGHTINDPKHYIKDQIKKVHPHDMAWLTE